MMQRIPGTVWWGLLVLSTILTVTAVMNNKMKNVLKILFILVSVTVFYMTPKNISVESRYTLTILFATLIAIIWYAIETNRIQRTMEHQLEVSTSAFLAISYNKKEQAFEIANVGNASAINITVDDLKLDVECKIMLMFPRYPYLRAGDSQLFQINSYKEGKPINFDFSAHLIKDYANKDYIVTVRFEDILRKKRCQQVRLGVSGPKLLISDEIMKRL